MTLPALERRVVVCVGCGGVGKTTVAAAIALEAARAGRRALVITIDPARRLADALGVETLGNQPEPLPRAALDALGVPAEGSLSALMLDMKRTFDDLVARFAESPAARERVLGNPIYRHVSDALAGSVEYSAMEKVYELSRSDDYDTLVVDTPPAQHALDFLDAPERLLEFLDSRLVHLLIHPAMAAGRLGFRWFEWGTRRALAPDRADQRDRLPVGRLRVPDGVRTHVGGVPRARERGARAPARAAGRVRARGEPGERVGEVGAALPRAARGEQRERGGDRREPRARLARRRPRARARDVCRRRHTARARTR